MPKTKLIVLFDPLCGWCYGASGIIKYLSEQPDIEIDYCPTGLFANDSAPPLSDAFASHIIEADKRITAMTGMEFSDVYRKNILEDRKTPVNSGPATMALVSVWLDDPDGIIASLGHIQRARYVEGQDITNFATLIHLLCTNGQSKAAQRLGLVPPELLDSYRQRIQTGQALMQKVNARGVPTIIVAKDETLTPLSSEVIFGGQDQLLKRIHSL